MGEQLDPEDYDLFARRHRECAALSSTPDMKQFHDALSERFARLATERRSSTRPMTP